MSANVDAAAAAAPGPAPGEKRREVVLKVDKRFGAIKVEAKSGEGADANFPKNLHNAAELFLRVGLVDNAERLRATTAAMFDIYAVPPDGRSAHSLGRAAVCWGCGHCGLPKVSKAGVADGEGPPRPCARCGDADQTNWVRVTRPSEAGSVPWIQETELDEKAKEAKQRALVQAKRAEVEASVAAALAARAAAAVVASREREGAGDAAAPAR